MELKAHLVLSLNVECEELVDVGSFYNGHLRVIPIVGGTFTGDIEGVVVSGGADWNTEKTNCAHVFAKYLLKTNDGEYIAIENEGIIKDFHDNTLIKTSPRFIVNENSKYDFLNYGVYVGSLEGGKQKNSVKINIYKML